MTQSDDNFEDLTPEEREWMDAPMGPIKQGAVKQLKYEIENAISRYGKESDVSVYHVIACLDVIKFNLIEKLK